MEEENVQNYLEETIITEENPVTVKILSRALDISRNEALCELTKFYERKRHCEGLTATYFICGCNSQGEMRLCVITESKLEKAKACLKDLTYHVFSVQKGPLEDVNVLYALDLQEERKNDSLEINAKQELVSDDLKRLCISYPNMELRPEEPASSGGASLDKQAPSEAPKPKPEKSPVKKTKKNFFAANDNNSKDKKPTARQRPILEGVGSAPSGKQKETVKKDMTQIRQKDSKANVTTKLKSPPPTSVPSPVKVEQDISPKSPPSKRNKPNNTVISQGVFNDDLFCSQESGSDDEFENRREPVLRRSPRKPESPVSNKNKQENRGKNLKKNEKSKGRKKKDKITKVEEICAKVEGSSEDDIIPSTPPPPRHTTVWHKKSITTKDEDGFLVVEAVSVPSDTIVQPPPKKKAPPTASATSKNPLIKQDGVKKQACISNFFKKMT